MLLLLNKNHKLCCQHGNRAEGAPQEICPRRTNYSLHFICTTDFIFTNIHIFLTLLLVLFCTSDLFLKQLCVVEGNKGLDLLISYIILYIAVVSK